MLKITSSDRRKLQYQLKRAADIDPGISRLIEQIGYPLPRKRAADFATLLQVITSQQLSTKAAAAINNKLSRCCGGYPTWRKILNRRERELRECGLSFRKIEYAKGLAESFANGDLVMDELAKMDTESVIEKLVEIRGFGRWSGEIFVMFALGRKDIYPADDLALQVAVQWYLNLDSRPTGKETAAIAERWSPYRSSVALLMWKYYGSTSLS